MQQEWQVPPSTLSTTAFPLFSLLVAVGVLSAPGSCCGIDSFVVDFFIISYNFQNQVRGKLPKDNISASGLLKSLSLCAEITLEENTTDFLGLKIMLTSEKNEAECTLSTSVVKCLLRMIFSF